MDRRQYLALGGGCLAASLGGCVGGDGDSDDDTDDTEDDSNEDMTNGGNETDNENGTEPTDGGDDGTDDGGDDGTDDGGDDSGNGEPAGGPIAAVERYFELLNSNQDVDSGDEVAELIAPLFHSQSPLLEFFENAEQTDGENTEPTRIPNPQLEITERNLSTQELTDSYTLTILPFVKEGDLDVLAGTNAVVRQATTTSESGNVERTPLFFLTKEDGEWVIYLTYTKEVTTN